MPKLSIVIITMNQRSDLRRCLDSLKETMCLISGEVIVVDNASNDGTVDMLREKYPKVIVEINKTNRGVAAARNQGLNIASGEYILILDNDTVANYEAISVMLSHLEQRPGTGIVACRLLNTDGSTQQSARSYPGLLVKVRNVLGIAEKTDTPVSVNEIMHPTYVIGACQMFPSRLISEIGLLDENIFYGPEDADFCIRTSSKGYTIDYLPNVTIFHNHRRSTTHRIFSTLACRHIKALLYFYHKHHHWF